MEHADQQITQAWIEARLNTIWPTHVVCFTRLLVELRKTFDGDLDAMLILAVVGIGSQQRNWRDVLIDLAKTEGQDSPTNIQSIADAAGIPRETVRRKLDNLQEAGWVIRNDLGNWVPTSQAAEDLKPATLATFSYIKAILNASLRPEEGLAVRSEKPAE